MRKTFLFFFVFSCFLATYAQTNFYLGGKAGFNIAHIRKIENPTGFDNKINLGSNVGFIFRVDVHKNIAVQAGWNFSQKGQRWKNKTDTIQYYQKFSLNYMEFPLLGVAKFGNEKFKALIYLGTYFGYWTGVSIQYSQTLDKRTIYKYNEDYSLSSNTKRFDMGIASGIGLNIKAGNGWLDIAVRHNAGMISILKNDKLYNCNMNISFGYIYNVGTLYKKTKTEQE
ncbi:MAG: PorT family protein [Chitinophagales bacterium]|nr:PorT family protein [Chitinophagales bacterium]